MPTLGEYVNVYNSALNTLRKKDYQLWYDEDSDMFCAERDGPLIRAELASAPRP